MKKLTSASVLAACAAALLGSAAPASASVVFDPGPATFPTSGTATQIGRLSRNGEPQDFDSSEPFPGSNNAGVTFNYITFTFTPEQLAGGPDVTVTLDDQGLFLFASAYLNSYNPPSATNPAGSFSTNWAGDQGSSGDFFGTAPGYFEVEVPTNDSLVLVLATSGPGGTGTGTPYTLLVQNFSDREYTDVSQVPEPSSLAAAGFGLLGLGYVARRRLTQSAAV